MWNGPMFVQWMTNNRDELYARQPMSRDLAETCEVLDHETGYARLAFRLGADHVNFTGRIHGGIIAWLLDEAVGVASVAHVGHRFKSTVEAKVSYYRSLRPGNVVAEARVSHVAPSMLFLEAKLFDEASQLVAQSTSTISIAPSSPINGTALPEADHQ